LNTFQIRKPPKYVSRGNHSIVPLSVAGGAEELQGGPAAAAKGLTMEDVLLTLSKLMEWRMRNNKNNGVTVVYRGCRSL
jgi:hypothetical protein